MPIGYNPIINQLLTLAANQVKSNETSLEETKEKDDGHAEVKDKQLKKAPPAQSTSNTQPLEYAILQTVDKFVKAALTYKTYEYQTGLQEARKQDSALTAQEIARFEASTSTSTQANSFGIKAAIAAGVAREIKNKSAGNKNIDPDIADVASKVAEAFIGGLMDMF